jgi:hypothetical protein
MTHGQSALGEVDLEKEMAADAGVIIHAYIYIGIFIYIYI